MTPRSPRSVIEPSFRLHERRSALAEISVGKSESRQLGSKFEGFSWVEKIGSPLHHDIDPWNLQIEASQNTISAQMLASSSPYLVPEPSP